MFTEVRFTARGVSRQSSILTGSPIKTSIVMLRSLGNYDRNLEIESNLSQDSPERAGSMHS